MFTLLSYECDNEFRDYPVILMFTPFYRDCYVFMFLIFELCNFTFDTVNIRSNLLI